MNRISYFTIFAAVLAALLFCSPALAEVSLSGDVEIDTNYISDSIDDGDDTTTYDSSGRIQIIPKARTENGDLYMEAVAEFLVRTTGEVDSDDVYGKIGTSTFDFQIGRYEGWDLFPKSNDMLVVEAPTGPAKYGTNYARGRFDTPGQFALHFFPSDTVGVELGMAYGNGATLTEYTWNGTDYTETEVNGNYIGIRPVVDIKIENFEVLAGLDYLKASEIVTNNDFEPEIDKFGYGLSAKGTFGIATVALNYAHGVVTGQTTAFTAAGTYTTADNTEETTTSIGGYCDLALGEGVLTLGGILTTYETDVSGDEDDTHNQYYVAYAHPLPIDGATIKFAVASATGTTNDVDSSATGFEMRLNYDF